MMVFKRESSFIYIGLNLRDHFPIHQNSKMTQAKEYFSDQVRELHSDTWFTISIHPAEFKKKEEVVELVVGMVKEGKKKDFKGG